MEHAGQGWRGLPRRARLASEKSEEAQKQSILMKSLTKEIHKTRDIRTLLDWPIYRFPTRSLSHGWWTTKSPVILNWYRCIEHWIPNGTTPIGKTRLEDGGGRRDSLTRKKVPFWVMQLFFLALGSGGRDLSSAVGVQVCLHMVFAVDGLSTNWPEIKGKPKKSCSSQEKKETSFNRPRKWLSKSILLRVFFLHEQPCFDRAMTGQEQEKSALAAFLARTSAMDSLFHERRRSARPIRRNKRSNCTPAHSTSGGLP